MGIFHSVSHTACSLSLILSLSNPYLSAAETINQSDSNYLVLGQIEENHPLWEGQLNILFLNRKDLPSRALLQQDSGQVLFNATDFDQPINVGWEIDLIRRINSEYRVEGLFFDLQSSDQTEGVYLSNPASGIPFGDGLRLPNITSSQSTLFYASRLQNMELNLRHDLNEDIEWICGFRYMNFQDEVRLQQYGLIFGEVDIDALQKLYGDNFMAGLQTGVDVDIIDNDRFSLSAFLKGGLYNNHCSNNITFDSINQNIHVQSGRSENHLNCSVDARLKGTFNLSDHVSLTAGYYVLWINNVVLASEQPHENHADLAAAVKTIDTNNYLLYHGLVFGTEIHW